MDELQRRPQSNDVKSSSDPIMLSKDEDENTDKGVPSVSLVNFMFSLVQR